MIETFSGLAAAMLKHRKGEYLCVPCLRSLSGASGSYSTPELERIGAEMIRRDRRFCEMCAVAVYRDEIPALPDGSRLCVDCQTSLEALDRDLDTAVRELSRRRFVQLFGLAVEDG